MKLIIHEPIPMDGYTNETKEKLMQRVRNVIGQGLM
jgi:hypothetical protein